MIDAIEVAESTGDEALSSRGMVRQREAGRVASAPRTRSHLASEGTVE
jgi:hypothetical protein